MTDEDFNRIQWVFKDEKLLGKKAGRGEVIRKTYASANTSPKLYKLEDYHKWTVRNEVRSRVDVSFQDASRKGFFENKDLGRVKIEIGSPDNVRGKHYPNINETR